MPNLKNLKILGDNILIDPIMGDEVVKAGMINLIKTQQYEDKAYSGKVLKIGSLVQESKLLGATVYFNQYASTKFPFEGKEYLILKSEDVLGFILSE